MGFGVHNLHFSGCKNRTACLSLLAENISSVYFIAIQSSLAIDIIYNCSIFNGREHFFNTIKCIKYIQFEMHSTVSVLNKSLKLVGRFQY